MKKVFIVLGGIFLVVLIIGGGGITYMAITGNALDRQSKAYADTAIPAIVDGWNEGALETRESPEFRTDVNRPDLDRGFSMLRKLGNLKRYDGAKGEARIWITPEHGKQITASYIGSAEFDGGPAQIILRLIKHGNQWQILAFRVNTPLFLRKPGHKVPDPPASGQI